MKNLRHLLLPVLLILFLPAAAEARSGQLDRGFGGTGKVTTTLGPHRNGQPEPSTYLAWAPKGRVVALVGTTLVEYLRNGRPNRHFGKKGRVKIAPAPGSTAEVAGVKVDSRGRVLVAGTVRHLNETASGFISRYLGNGRADASFGNGGTVLTTLGLPAATPPQTSAGSPPLPQIAGPVVEFSDLAVDGADRPLVSGSWTSGFQLCYPMVSYTPKDTGFVARLNENGSADSSFGNGGVLADPSQELSSSLLPDDSGVVFVAGPRPSRCDSREGNSAAPVLQRANETGRLDPTFGSNGKLALAGSLLARDPFGRIVTLDWTETELPILQRLTGRGTIDPRFGSKGTASFLLKGEPGGAALATDQRGRPIIAVSVNHAGYPASLQLIRRLRNGRGDRTFGKHGGVTVRFDTDVLSPEVLVGGNSKIVVGGTLLRSDTYGIALARYNAR